MKRLFAILILCACTGAMAQHRHYHGHHHHHGHANFGWVAPALIGGAVVYALTRPTTAMPAPVVTVPVNDVVYIDGVAYRKQLMLINGYYQEILVRM